MKPVFSIRIQSWKLFGMEGTVSPFYYPPDPIQDRSRIKPIYSINQYSDRIYKLPPKFHCIHTGTIWSLSNRTRRLMFNCSNVGTV